jgi:outer membrane translocation and assembly module TamA
VSNDRQNFLCGDGETPGWRRVPLNQAEFFARRFLAGRGYFFPKFSGTSEGIEIDAGPLSRIREVQLPNAPLPIPIRRYWQIKDEEMTSAALGGLEKWLKEYLARHGYPCVELDVAADPVSGLVRVSVVRAERLQMPRVLIDPVPDMEPDVPRRYHAIDAGEWYDGLRVDLSARRLVADQTVLNSYMMTQCPSNGGAFSLRQRIIPGEPRLATFGIGFDTEEWLMVQASWQHARLGRMASELQTKAQASYRVQSLQVSYDAYYLPSVSRHLWHSSLRFDREYEEVYEANSHQLRSGPAWSLDELGNYWRLWLGGVAHHIETVKGEGPATTDLGLIHVDGMIQSHDYEYFAVNPRSGHQLNFSTQRAWKGSGAALNLTHYSASWVKLWNLGEYDPPIWVLGLRGKYVSTAVDSAADLAKLPVWFAEYLGGSRDLRGFRRRSIPDGESGALSVFYSGIELRMRSIVPFGLQPLAFVDYGRIAQSRGRFEPEIYWSPGVGVHIQSAIGPVRLTLARGQVIRPEGGDVGPAPRWQFYLGLGEQF